MNDDGPFYNTEIKTNEILLKEAGSYYVIYSFYPRITTDAATTLTLSLRTNTNDIPSTRSSAAVPSAASFNLTYEGNTIVKVLENTTLDAAILSSAANGNVEFQAEQISSIILFKID